MSTGSQFRGDRRFYITLCSVRYTRSLRDAPPLPTLSRALSLIGLVCAFLFLCVRATCALVLPTFLSNPLPPTIPPPFLTFKEYNDSTPLPGLCFLLLPFVGVFALVCFIILILLLLSFWMMRFCICVWGPSHRYITSAAKAIGEKKWQDAFWFSFLSWLSTLEMVTSRMNFKDMRKRKIFLKLIFYSSSDTFILFFSRNLLWRCVKSVPVYQTLCCL